MVGILFIFHRLAIGQGKGGFGLYELSHYKPLHPQVAFFCHMTPGYLALVAAPLAWLFPGSFCAGMIPDGRGAWSWS